MKQEIAERMQRIEGLVRQIETSGDPSIRAVAVELMKSLLEMQGAGLERMLEIICDAGPGGQSMIDSLGEDEIVGPLLVLHGLHPLPLETRVGNALERVRPYLKSHGGNVELTEITADGVVKLKLDGSCKSCPSSSITLKLAVEDAIYHAAPDVVAVEAEGVTTAQSAGTLIQISGRAADGNGNGSTRGNGWEEVSGVNSIPNHGTATRDIAGRSVLFCRVGENFYAYGNNCAGCGQSLGDSAVETSTLVCSACGQQYDLIQAGKGLDQSNLHLEPFPLLIEQGKVKVALPPRQQSNWNQAFA